VTGKRAILIIVILTPKSHRIFLFPPEIRLRRWPRLSILISSSSNAHLRSLQTPLARAVTS